LIARCIVLSARMKSHMLIQSGFSASYPVAFVFSHEGHSEGGARKFFA
jgi:hypothetical protein